MSLEQAIGPVHILRRSSPEAKLPYEKSWEVDPHPDPERTAQLLARMKNLVYIPSADELRVYTEETGYKYYPPSEQIDHSGDEPPPSQIFTVSYINKEGTARIELPAVEVENHFRFFSDMRQKGLVEGKIFAVKCNDRETLMIDYRQVDPDTIESAEKVEQADVTHHYCFTRDYQPPVKSILGDTVQTYGYPLLTSGVFASWLGSLNKNFPASEGHRSAIVLHFKTGETIVFSSASYRDFFPPSTIEANSL